MRHNCIPPDANLVFQGHEGIIIIINFDLSLVMVASEI